jgi:hypothetical protein
VISWRAIAVVGAFTGVLASVSMIVVVRALTDDSLGATAATLTDFVHGVLGVLAGIALAAAIASALRPTRDALVTSILGAIAGYLWVVFPVLAVAIGDAA